MTGPRTFSAATWILLAAAPALSAQSASHDRGLWIGAGLGHSVSSWEMTFTPTPPELGLDAGLSALSGTGGYVRLGGTVSRRIRLGGEIAVAAFPLGTGQTLRRTNFGVVALVQPLESRGAFVKATVGGAIMAWPGRDLDGVGTGMALGWDVRVAPRLYATPSLEFMQQWSTARTGGVALLSLGMTWRR